LRTVGREEAWSGGNPMAIRDEILAEAYELALQNDMTYSG
jgi:hypothetical protein